MKSSQSQPPRASKIKSPDGFVGRSSVAPGLNPHAFNLNHYSQNNSTQGVEDELNILEQKVKRGKDIKSKWLAEKTKTAQYFAEQANDKMFKVRQERDLQDQERINSFVRKKIKHENKIAQNQKQKNAAKQHLLTKKQMHFEVVQNNLKNNEQDIEEQNEKLDRKIKVATENLEQNKNTFKRNMMLRQERENLRMLDAQRNIER